MTNATSGLSAPRSTKSAGLRWLFTSAVFYPAMALIVGLMILASLQPHLREAQGRPQAGVAQNAARAFGPTELAAAEAGPGFVVHVRAEGGVPKALRVGVRPGVGPVTPGDAGVRLHLDPAAMAGLAGKPLLVELRVRSIEVTNAPVLAVAVEGDGPAPFVEKPLVLGEATLSFDAPALEGPPRALVLRPLSDRDDYVLGVEIVSVRISPRAG